MSKCDTKSQLCGVLYILQANTIQIAYLRNASEHCVFITENVYLILFNYLNDVA